MTVGVTEFIARDRTADRVPQPGGLVHATDEAHCVFWKRRLTTTVDHRQSRFAPTRVWQSMWGDHMWRKVACLIGVHDWSEWRPADSENPSRQLRTCARCQRVKFNDPAAPLRWQDQDLY
jgi:hypothetical protein